MREEEAYWLQKQIKRLHRQVQRQQPEVDGVSSSALQILVAVEQAGRALRPGELAEELEMTTSNVAAALRSLERGRLVVREPDPGDGRKAFVNLTPAGADVIAEVRRGNHAWLQQAIADTLTADEQRLLLQAGDLMRRLCEQAAPAGRRRVLPEF
ncbi:MarR family winged helix-turn-helix transcriptional regulator [Streptomyces sp. NPDC096311]|uniref:MarR family winged helix-turn-helix transcriptional regulator n=1 Tax=Streptomyces sp. NPDC096311 TaxID=3366083 RepID=UPI0037FA5BDF